MDMTTFVKTLPAPFEALARSGSTQGFCLFVAVDGYCEEWAPGADGSVEDLVRVECWVESGNQYVYTERLRPGDPWAPPVMGEHSVDQHRVDSLEDIYAVIPSDAQEIHTALHQFRQ